MGLALRGLCITALVLHPGHLLSAQRSEVSLEAGASSVKPPAGVEGESARFLVAGIRALRFGPEGSGVSASLLVGRALEEGTGGDFYSGTIAGELWHPLGAGWWAGGEVRGFGFQVSEPFPYRSLGVEGGPALRFSRGVLSATARGIAGTGWSRTELQRFARGPAIAAKDDLWRYGGSVEVLAGSTSIMGGVAAGIHESLGGTYRSAGLRLLAGKRGLALELRIDAWHTPAGHETTGGIALMVPLGAWSFRGFLGRTEPDPLTLSEPGGGSGGLLVGWRVLGTDALPAPHPPLHQILDRVGDVARVRFHVQAPAGASRVELMGDFTLWEPVAMRREGNQWIVDLEVPDGTFHFGFLVDGAWFLPDDAPDTVSDEWGRKNSTIVIENGRPTLQPSAGEAMEGGTER